MTSSDLGDGLSTGASDVGDRKMVWPLVDGGDGVSSLRSLNRSSSGLGLLDSGDGVSSGSTASTRKSLGGMLSGLRRSKNSRSFGIGDMGGEASEIAFLRKELAESKRETQRLAELNSSLASRLAVVEQTLRDEREASRPERDEIVKNNDSLRELAQTATMKAEVMANRAHVVRTKVKEELIARGNHRSQSHRSLQLQQSSTPEERRRKTLALDTRVRALSERLRRMDGKTRAHCNSAIQRIRSSPH